jgi:hypothetical protein
VLVNGLDPSYFLFAFVLEFDIELEFDFAFEFDIAFVAACDALAAAFAAVFAAFAAALAAFAIWLAAVFSALAAAFIALAAALFALALALFVSLPPQAIPRAVKARSPVSAIIFFITKVISCLSQRLTLLLFLQISAGLDGQFQNKSF